MRETGPCHKQLQNESAVANMIEYLMISAVIMGLFIVVLLLVNTNIMEDPANRLIYVAFTDIGNGVSTRIVDVYAIAPIEGDITTHFDIPDEIVGRGYLVELGSGSAQNSANQEITVSRGYLNAHIAIAGIASTRGVSGNTTGAGMNLIKYNSSGF
jgi:hypothetical protein